MWSDLAGAFLGPYQHADTIMVSLFANQHDTVDASNSATISFIDLAFTSMAERSVLDEFSQRPADAPFAYVVTPNVDHAVRLQRSRSDLWPVYRSAWLILCDSKILGLLARRVGFRVPVLAGSDLTRLMLEAVIKPTDSVAIIGGDARLANQLAARYGLESLHHYNPPMGFIHDPVEVAKTVRFVIDAKARYSFFAVGSPQQEILAYRVRQAGGGCGIGLCIGASLDFLTGTQKRAPAFMRYLAMEWLHRLVSNPKRMWRRYLYVGPSIFHVVRNWQRNRTR